MLATVLGILIGIAVPLASFVTGLRTTDPLWLWKRPRLLARSLVTILVAVPVVAALLVEVLAPDNVPLKAGIVVSILAIGVGPPDLMNRSEKAKDVAGYEI